MHSRSSLILRPSRIPHHLGMSSANQQNGHDLKAMLQSLHLFQLSCLYYLTSGGQLEASKSPNVLRTFANFDLTLVGSIQLAYLTKTCMILTLTSLLRFEVSGDNMQATDHDHDQLSRAKVYTSLVEFTWFATSPEYYVRLNGRRRGRSGGLRPR